MRIFAFVIAAFMAAFIAAPVSAADPSTPASPTVIQPKPAVHNPAAPSGIVPMGLFGTDETAPTASSPRRIVPPLEIGAPTPDHPGTWIPDPDMAGYYQYLDLVFAIVLVVGTAGLSVLLRREAQAPPVEQLKV